MADPAAIPQRRIRWQPAWRIVPSRYPAVGPWDRIAAPADFDALAAIEGLTNPRLRQDLGVLSLTPRERWLTGPGSTPVMAAFTHLNPEGSRFSDGSYGVYYAAHSLATAVAEVSHHRAVFLRRTDEPAIDIDMRLVTANVEAELHDLSGAGHRQAANDAFAEVLDPDHYGASQRLGSDLRAAGSWGLRYPSVRDDGGECVAIFRPRALRHAKSALHLALHWDGQRISHWYEKTQPQSLAP